MEEAPPGQGTDGAASTAKRNPCVGAMAAFDIAQFRSPPLRQVSPMLASDDEVCVEATATLTDPADERGASRRGMLPWAADVLKPTARPLRSCNVMG